MATILNLESATGICSVSIGKDGALLALRETDEARSAAAVITVFTEEIIKESGIAFKELDAVAVSGGPGSYTGLRIGVSTAKGYCFALDIPLISISTLQAMAYGVSQKVKQGLFKDVLSAVNDENILLCPMIDARRMEVYTSFYNLDLETIKPVSADIIDEHSYEDILKDKKMLFFGDGAGKCKETFAHQPNAIFLDDNLPTAMNMIALSEKKFNDKNFEDLAYFEPFYLKDFVATKPKNKFL